MGRRDSWGRQSSQVRLRTWAALATVAGLAIALIALVIEVVDAGGRDESVRVATTSVPVAAASPPSQVATLPPPHLKRIDMTIRNVFDSGGGPVFEERPELELLLQNVGRGRSIVSRARIEVIRRYHLPICFTQGGIPLGSRYGALLSPAAKPGDVVEVPLHEQLGPDQPDRFLIKLAMAPGTKPDGFYLFELRLSLAHDGVRRRLPMGKALVAFPFPPKAGDVLLPARYSTRMNHDFNSQRLPVRRFWAGPMACWRANARLLRRALASDAPRSRELGEGLDGAILHPRFVDLTRGRRAPP